MNDNFTVSWLSSTIEEDVTGVIISNDLKSKYEDACIQTNVTPLTEVPFFKVIFRIFTDSKKSRKRLNGSRPCIITGITWKNERDITKLLPLNIKDYVSKQWMIASITINTATLMMMSNVVTNGNIVMKEVNLNFNDKTWGIRVRGIDICLENFGLSKEFDTTKGHLDEILNIASKFRVCTGVENKDKKNVPTYILMENVSIVGDENSSKIKMRTKTCSQVIGWLGISNSCKICITNLNKFKNEEKDMVNLNKYDNDDMKKIFDAIFPGASPEMKDFLQVQHDVLSSNQVRWQKSVLKICLSLWCKSKNSYEELKDSNIFKLPSGRHLRRYKNAVPQKAGVNDDIFRWMRNSAKKAKLPAAGYHGGILHDEAKIQEDLVLNMKGDKCELVGWIDTGEEGESLRIIKGNSISKKLASDVLQVTFLGNTGFRFPIAHFPTDGVKASELFIIMWEIISKLQSWGFVVNYIMQDGGQQNREYTKLHFRNEPRDNFFTSDSLVNPTRKLLHCQDHSHNMKKLRNAVLSSGIQTFHTKLLTHNGNVIVWDQWLNAAKWDEQTNSRKLHHKLSNAHLHPDSSEKMRNHLSEEVLNEDMVNLMKCYQASLVNGSVLNAAVEFLEQTSKLISIFRDHRPVLNIEDSRLYTLRNVLEWFKEWITEAENGKNIASNNRKVPSRKCLDDVQSTIIAFIKVCEIHLAEFKGYGIYPSRFNSDLAENIFCQQRGLYNGNTTNPTYNTYCSTMNSIIIGQTSISKSRARKSNAGSMSTDPYSFAVNMPLCKKRKSIRV